MATSFFGGAFFGGEFFSQPTDQYKGGRGDNKYTVKPTGLLHLPKKKEGRKDVADRVDDSHAIQAEIAARLAREFGEDNAAIAERERIELTQAEATAEIARLLRKKIRTEEDDIILMLLMAAAVA